MESDDSDEFYSASEEFFSDSEKLELPIIPLAKISEHSKRTLNNYDRR